MSQRASLAARSYALLLDVDGTLLDPYGRVRESARGALTRARDAGVVIMLATGRGHGGIRPLMRELGLDALALVFNGSALYCPREDRLIERLVLHDALVAQLHALALQRDILFVIDHGDELYARSPRDAGEAALLDWIGTVRPLPTEPLSPDQTLCIALFSAQHGTSLALRDEVRDLAAHPAHYAHFSLTFFPELRDLPRQSLDVQPLCDGEAEAFRVLAARFGGAQLWARASAIVPVSVTDWVPLHASREEPHVEARAPAGAVWFFGTSGKQASNCGRCATAACVQASSRACPARGATRPGSPPGRTSSNAPLLADAVFSAADGRTGARPAT